MTYTGTVVVHIPWGVNAEDVKEFVVAELNDLNQQYETLEKVEERGEKTFGLLCCESGPLSVKLRLEKTGFVSGENINFRVEVIFFKKYFYIFLF